MVVTTLMLGVLVGLPLLAVFMLNQSTGITSGFDFWGPVIAITVSVTSMSVSGIFVFMSFRIDRGVKSQTREEVRDLLSTTMKVAFSAAGKQAKKRFDAAKQMSDDKFEEITKEIEAIKVEVAKTTESITTTNDTVENTRKSIDEKCKTIGEDIQGRFDGQLKDLDAHFNGVYDLIQTLRRQILESVLSTEVTKTDKVTLDWTAGPDPDSNILRWEYQMKEAEGKYGDWKPIPYNAAKLRTYDVDVQEKVDGSSYVFRVRVQSEDMPAMSNESSVVVRTSKPTE